jgi:hypothetical protein
MNLCDGLGGRQAEQDTKGERPRHNGLDNRFHDTVPGAGAGVIFRNAVAVVVEMR